MRMKFSLLQSTLKFVRSLHGGFIRLLLILKTFAVGDPNISNPFRMHSSHFGIQDHLQYGNQESDLQAKHRTMIEIFYTYGSNPGRLEWYRQCISLEMCNVSDAILIKLPIFILHHKLFKKLLSLIHKF